MDLFAEVKADWVGNDPEVDPYPMIREIRHDKPCLLEEAYSLLLDPCHQSRFYHYLGNPLFLSFRHPEVEPYHMEIRHPELAHQKLYRVRLLPKNLPPEEQKEWNLEVARHNHLYLLPL